ITVSAGSQTMLSLMCSIPSTATPGTIAVSVVPSSFSGTGSTTGATVTGTQGLTPSGSSGGLINGLVVITNLPNTSGPSTGTGGTTGTGTGVGSTGSGVGLPNTGA